tara:strand:- start:1051 stop:1890 length:840 start_codon:yes stop_codon:yes gene_type:complete
MRLTDDQVRQYDEDGYVVLHGILTPAEVRLLQAEAEILRTDKRGHPDANVYEKDGVSLRAAWCVEMDSDACRLAMSMQRIFGPVRQLMGERAYLYQSRLNYKVAGRGDVFQWHQDYGSWVEDGVPSGGHREMLSVLVMLDDTEHESGPLRIIPGSHKAGLIRSKYDTETTSYALHVVPDEEVDRLSAAGGLVECTGKAGTVMIFGSLLVHGSQQNISQNDRRNLYFAYNVDDNLPDPNYPRRQHACPYIMSPETGPLEFTSDVDLLEIANRKRLTAAPV